MNAYFLFGWQETYYINEIAKRLQDHEAVDKIGGLSNHERYHEYLLEQDDVEYDVLHSIPRIHDQISDRPLNRDRLKEIEQEYGNPSLWPYVLVDRQYISYDHHDQQRLIQHWFDFFLDLFDEFEPDLYLGYGVAASFTWIPYVLTRELGGTAISWKSVRVRNRYDLEVNDAQDRFRFHSLFKRFEEGVESPDDYPEARADAASFLEEFRTEDVRPSYFSTPDTGIDLDTVRSTLALPYKAVRYYARKNFRSVGPNYMTDDFRVESTRDLAAERVNRAYRKARIKYTDVFDEPDPDDNFVLFPLHVQPEAATMLLAPMYIDQPALVKQIARSLPIGHKLYVKEHPNMLGERSLSYYDRFDDLTNLKLIHPLVDAHRMIRESDMVTTIAGTAGLEALFLETPVMAFGKVHYDVMDMVYDGGDPDDIADCIYHGLHEYEHDEAELRRYLTAMFAESFDIPGSDFASSDRGAVERAEAIYPEIEPYLEQAPGNEPQEQTAE